jgi:NADH-quinone oxidoreductase subunit M
MDILFSTLTLVTFFPLIGVAVLAYLRAEQVDAIRWVALGTTVITLVISLVMLAQFNSANPDFQLVTRAPWIAFAGLRVDYFLAVDGVSVWLVLLTTLLMPIAIGAAWNSVEHGLKTFMILFLLLEVGMVGAFLALDLLLFYVFFEFTLLPMLFLIGVYGGERRVYAAVKFLLFTLAGSVFMLVAILWIGLSAGTFAFTELRGLGYGPAAVYLFAAFAIAFAIKVPIWPLHTWLPDAHVEAPTSGSVILAGVLLKLGTYGLLRFNVGLFPDIAHQAAPLFGVLAVIGILYGAMAAFAQTDAKKLVAYSSVSHLGFVVLGIFALNPLGMQGAVLQMVNHGLSTGALFLLVGYIYERRHTRELSAFGGLWKVMPGYAALALVAFLSSAGLPGMNGFVGEFTILIGAYSQNSYASTGFAVVAAVGVILSAVYLLWLFFRMFQGPVSDAHNQGLTDLSRREVALLVPLVFFIFMIGLYPRPFFDAMAPAVNLIASQVQIALQVAGVN